MEMLGGKWERELRTWICWVLFSMELWALRFSAEFVFVFENSNQHPSGRM